MLYLPKGRILLSGATVGSSELRKGGVFESVLGLVCKGT